MIRLGRIAYVNMAPVFYRVDAEVDEVLGVPTELNRMLVARELDTAPISSIEYARNADSLRLLPRLCVASEGAVDSIQLVARVPLERVRTVAVTPESATSVALTKVLMPEAEQAPLETYEAGEAEAKLLIGDAALRSAFEDPTPHHDLGRLWLERTGLPMVFAVWACPEPLAEGLAELEDALVVLGAAGPRRARAARVRGGRALRLSGRLPRALLREAPLSLRPARARRPLHVPRARPRRRAARDRARAPLRPDHRRGCRMSVAAERTPVAEILERAVSGERITDGDAVELLRSRDLVAVGRAANEIRNRLHDPERVTFIIDRNLNYTNVCVTDCDFCAFYRRPGDQREGYLLPKPVIFKKIEETLALGGTGLLMQGGHHPDLGVDYYEDLFSSIKARYRIHLHALSPSEIVHAARRSKLTVPETLARMRDAGLDSIPGGGAEILVDRVRDIIAPKKVNTKEWLGVMREAHRLGISTTATMMYGHVETLEERVEHFRRVRELQDETGGFRAFFSWTFQDDGNRLVSLVPVEARPTSFDYLLTQAVSRIYLDNMPHIGSSWVTQGKKIGQVALGFGADDLGSVMIEENVVSAAGTTHRTSAEELVHLIRSLGKTAVQRDTLYRDVKVWD